MMLTYIISLCIIGSYFLLILVLTFGFNCLKNKSQHHEACIPISIIIPFRNEEKNLLPLLNSISKLAYNTSLFEVLLVDDDSTDNSVKQIELFKSQNPTLVISIIKNNRHSNSPKKDAISTAIKIARYNWVICTDADCILPKYWLKCYSDFINTHDPNMVIAPVSIKSNNSFLHQFQLIDFLSMQGATIGGFGIQQPFMANGANMGYKKEVFLKLNGFENNNSIASGDDVFLLEDFITYQKSKVLFLKNKEALVTTFPTNTWATLINQRKRWASKATHFTNLFTKLVGVLVFLANSFAITSLVLVIFNTNFIWLYLSKVVIDTILIYKTANLYQQNINSFAYIRTVLYHPFFTAYIAISCMLTTFEWKDRAFKK
ncbi:MAG: glycosyltransferase family 2 protein [Flavobacteriaceae bacterium]